MIVNCPWCEEPVLPEDHLSDIRSTGEGLIHFECGFRMIVGSVGHLNRQCSCYGGKQEDPPDMTKRQAAIAALSLYREIHASHIPPVIVTAA